jgi:hypothetical protein
MHHWVLAIGLTSLDQRQPGSKRARPIMVSAIVTISTAPFGNERVSSGLIEAPHLHGPHGTPPQVAGEASLARRLPVVETGKIGTIHHDQPKSTYCPPLTSYSNAAAYRTNWHPVPRSS